MLECMSNRRDRVSICDPLTLSGLQSGLNRPKVWFCGESLRDDGFCVSNDPLAT